MAEDEYSVYIGVAIAVTSNIIISFALATQKKAHNHLAMTRGNYLKSPLWWAGFFLIFTGETGNFLAYGFAPASLVAPLGTVALIVNAIIAPWYLKETFRMKDLVGILLAVAGTTIIIVFFKSEAKVLTPKDMIDFLLRLRTLCFVIVTLVLIIFCTLLSAKKKYVFNDISIVALYGGYTVLAAKTLSSLLTRAFSEAIASWLFYCALLVLIVTAVVQVRYLNIALQRYENTVVMPIQFVLFNLSVIAGSAVVFDDFDDSKPLNLGLFAFGCLLNFFGIYIIANNRKEISTTPASDSEDIIRLLDDTPIEAPVTIYNSFLEPEGVANETQPEPLLKRGLSNALLAIEAIGSTVSQTHSLALPYDIYQRKSDTEDKLF